MTPLTESSRQAIDATRRKEDEISACTSELLDLKQLIIVTVSDCLFLLLFPFPACLRALCCRRAAKKQKLGPARQGPRLLDLLLGCSRPLCGGVGRHDALGRAAP